MRSCFIELRSLSPHHCMYTLWNQYFKMKAMGFPGDWGVNSSYSMTICWKIRLYGTLERNDTSSAVHFFLKGLGFKHLWCWFTQSPYSYWNCLFIFLSNMWYNGITLRFLKTTTACWTPCLILSSLFWLCRMVPRLKKNIINRIAGTY